MQQGCLIDPEFNTSSLHFTDGFRQVEGNRSGLGTWHKTAWPKLFTEPANLAHHIRSSNGHVKAKPVFFNSLDQIVETHEIRTCCLSFKLFECFEIFFAMLFWHSVFALLVAGF